MDRMPAQYRIIAIRYNPEVMISKTTTGIAMGRRLQDILQSLPEERRQRILSRGQELIAEVLALRQLRQRLSISQREMAERLEVSQPAISQLEQQRDMQLSTLRNYVAALGGELEIVVRLPGQLPIVLQQEPIPHPPLQ
jgi:DNA-binding XRE family transcriptional regulator